MKIQEMQKYIRLFLSFSSPHFAERRVCFAAHSDDGCVNPLGTPEQGSRFVGELGHKACSL